MSFYQMHRGWMDNDVFGDEPYTKAQAWEWMIGEANWKDGIKAILGKPIMLHRGELSDSIRFMAEKFGWTKAKVENFLNRLEKFQMIRTDNRTGQLIITICNYEEYQAPQDTEQDSQQDTSRTAAGQQQDKQEEINKFNKGNKKNIPARPEDISESVWEDFKSHRKAKNAPLTQTALNGIRKEADLAGISLDDALREVCARGWQSFKAEWYLKSKGNGNGTINGNGTNGNPRAGNKHERAKAALRQSGIDLGYLEP